MVSQPIYFKRTKMRTRSQSKELCPIIDITLIAKSSVLKHTELFACGATKKAEKRKISTTKENGNEGSSGTVALKQCVDLKPEVKLHDWWLVLREADLEFAVRIEGYRTDCKQLWHTNWVVRREQDGLLLTESGGRYRLEGEPRVGLARGCPEEVINRFVNGFPADWKELLLPVWKELGQKKEEHVEREIKQQRDPSPQPIFEEPEETEMYVEESSEGIEERKKKLLKLQIRKLELKNELLNLELKNKLLERKLNHGWF